jgi:hypothetical protein
VVRAECGGGRIIFTADGKLFFPATSLTCTYIQHNKLYETTKHATTDEYYVCHMLWLAFPARGLR